MATFNGNPVTQRGGAGAGRGDNPHALPPGQGAHSSAFFASGPDSMNAEEIRAARLAFADKSPEIASLVASEMGSFKRDPATPVVIRKNQTSNSTFQPNPLI